MASCSSTYSRRSNNSRQDRLSRVVLGMDSLATAYTIGPDFRVEIKAIAPAGQMRVWRVYESTPYDHRFYFINGKLVEFHKFDAAINLERMQKVRHGK